MKKANKIIVRAIKFYQEYIAVYKKHSCRFYPSCSNYALISFKKYSFFKAAYKSFYRILRCNPFSPGGVDEP